jgi:hypothetical protein
VVLYSVSIKFSRSSALGGMKPQSEEQQIGHTVPSDAAVSSQHHSTGFCVSQFY